MDGGFQLTLYDAARCAIAECLSTDELRHIRDNAEAMRAYGRQAKDKRMETDAAEIRFRAERRLGELMQAQRETVGLASGGRPYQAVTTGSKSDPITLAPTLAEAGIDKHLADRARKLAAVPVAEFEQRIDQWRERVEEETERVTVDLLTSGDKHIRGTFGTGDNEWFTPHQYIAAAREVMGGIDLDPASHAVAQRTVRATRFFTREDDGLAQEWRGRVWMNPPYAQPMIAQFISKLIGSVSAGRVQQAVLLTNNYTDTKWFHEAAGAATAVCFTLGRIRFVDPDGEAAAPIQGQAFFYFGSQVDRFVEVFGAFGLRYRS